MPINLNKLDAERCTLEVTVFVTRQFRWRIWVGKQLFRLGAAVIGCSLQFKSEEPH